MHFTALLPCIERFCRTGSCRSHRGLSPRWRSPPVATTGDFGPQVPQPPFFSHVGMVEKDSTGFLQLFASRRPVIGVVGAYSRHPPGLSTLESPYCVRDYDSVHKYRNPHPASSTHSPQPPSVPKERTSTYTKTPRRRNFPPHQVQRTEGGVGPRETKKSSLSATVSSLHMRATAMRLLPLPRPAAAGPAQDIV